MKEFEFRASDFVEFYKCRRAWMYHRLRGWEVPSLGKKAEIGSMFHAGLEEMYRDLKNGEFDGNVGATIDTGIGNYVATHDESLLDAAWVVMAGDMCRYYWEHRGCKDPIKKIVTVEQNSFLLVPTPLGNAKINCHIDVAFESEDNILVVRDHKTKDAIPTDYSWFDLDTQMKIYLLNARANFAGEQVDGQQIAVEHNLVRREVPPGFGHRPLYNEGIDKNGKPYKRKSTASTDPGDYFKTVRYFKGEEALEAFENDLERMATELIEATMRGEEGFYFGRSPSTLCNSCSYLTPCVRENDGEQVNFDLTSLLYMNS